MSTELVVDLDLTRFGAYLRSRFPGEISALKVEKVTGGQSNPTFFVTFADRRLVLRKQPQGNSLPSAHAVDREFKVMTALAGRGVPVPQMIFLEEDISVIGSKFYIMERLDGRVFHDSALGNLQFSDRGLAWSSLARVMATLHSIDWRDAGLSDFGRAGMYFDRQIRRWKRQWELSRTREIPDIGQLASWLEENIPKDDRTTIVHGDYRIGNVMYHATKPSIIGVLDWELSTLGHPFADLAHTSTMWFIRPDEYGGLLGVDLKAQGIPPRQAFEDEYLRAAGLSEGLTPFHLAFALFRFAIIFEGIASRAKAGSAAADNAAEVGRLSSIFARRAVDLLSADGTLQADHPQFMER